MSTFSLKIVTPDGLKYDGLAHSLTVRTTTGEMGILPGHISCVAPLGMGMAAVGTEEGKRYAACIGGMVSVVDGAVTLVPTTFEWSEAIDRTRAEESRKRAQAVLEDKSSTDTDIKLAQARLKRALIRISVSQYKPK